MIQKNIPGFFPRDRLYFFVITNSMGRYNNLRLKKEEDFILMSENIVSFQWNRSASLCSFYDIIFE